MIKYDDLVSNRWYVAELVDNKYTMDGYTIVNVFEHTAKNGETDLRVGRPDRASPIESYNFLSGPFTPQGVINMSNRKYSADEKE